VTDKEIFIDETKGLSRFLIHSMALIFGLLLLIAGLAMGVSLELLPGGLIVGVVGFLLIVFGLCINRKQK